MKFKKLIFTGVVAGVLVGCGGGGSSSTPSSATDLTMSGTAATGKAIAGATVSAKCQVGTGTATTIADGTYNLVVAGGKLPCVLEITNPLDGSKLHTVATGSGSSTIANITPLTEMLTARVLRNEPVVFFAAFDAAVAASTITTAAVKAAQTDVGTILSGTVDTSSLGDFIATPLKAATQDNVTGGEAQDKMLDALREKFNAAQLTQVVTALANITNTADIKQVVANIAEAPPTANAGVAQSVVTGAAITLDASASSAAAGSSLTYAWTLTSKPTGSAATLASPTTVKPTFVADVVGTYVASLIVNDGKINSSADAVIIIASNTNAVPIANAGDAQSVMASDSVMLQGRGSDANNDHLTYDWTLTSRPTGSLAVLTASTAWTPFTPDVAGIYIARLVVNDGKVSSSPSSVSITASVKHDYTNVTDFTKLGSTVISAVNLMNSKLLASPSYLDDLLSKNTVMFDLPVQNYFGSDIANDIARAQITVSTIKADFPVEATADKKPYRLVYNEFDSNGTIKYTLRMGALYGCSNANDVKNPTAECVQYSYEAIANNAIQFSASGSLNLVKETVNGLVYLSPLIN